MTNDRTVPTQKISNGEVTTFHLFEHNFKLIIDNAKLFNPEHDLVHKKAIELYTHGLSMIATAKKRLEQKKAADEKRLQQKRAQAAMAAVNPVHVPVETSQWVSCDACNKWRRLPPQMKEWEGAFVCATNPVWIVPAAYQGDTIIL